MQVKNRMLLLLRNSSKPSRENNKEDGRIEYDMPLQRSILTKNH